MMWTDDPARDWDRYCDEQERWAKENLPRCSECNDLITDDYCFEINDELICQGCLISNYRKRVEDCVE